MITGLLEIQVTWNPEEASYNVKFLHWKGTACALTTMLTMSRLRLMHLQSRCIELGLLTHADYFSDQPSISYAFFGK